MTTLDDLDLDEPTGTEPVGEPAKISQAPPPAAAGWQVDKSGREYIPKPQGRGMIYRLDGETVEAALARDAQPRDKRPKRKTKTPKMPEAPKQVDLKELEAQLAEALRSPAGMCAMMGDEWGAQHFENAGPYLARNLIIAADHNPWLRQKLEAAATGQDAMMRMMTLMPLASATIIYFAVPIIYYFNLPAPEQARQMFGIPPRKEQPPEYAVPTASPNGAEPAFDA